MGVAAASSSTDASQRQRKKRDVDRVSTEIPKTGQLRFIDLAYLYDQSRREYHAKARSTAPGFLEQGTSSAVTTGKQPGTPRSGAHAPGTPRSNPGTPRTTPGTPVEHRPSSSHHSGKSRPGTPGWTGYTTGASAVASPGKAPRSRVGTPR